MSFKYFKIVSFIFLIIWHQKNEIQKMKNKKLINLVFSIC